MSASESYWVKSFELPSGEKTITLLGPDGVVECVDRFLVYGTRVQWSPNTLRSYARDLKDWFEFLGQQNLKWDTVPVQFIPDWIEWLRHGDLRPVTTSLVPLQPKEIRKAVTVNHKLSALYTFYRYYPESSFAKSLNKLLIGRAKTAPHLKGSAFSLREPNRAVHALTREEVGEILKFCSSIQEQLFIGFMVYRGMRIGQVLGLRHEDISVQRLEYQIVPRNNNINGARAKTRQVHKLPLTGDLARLYRRYLFDEYGLVDSDYVFINLSGANKNQPMCYDDTRPLLYRLQRSTGINFTWHVLRHTFATHEIARGTSLSAVQAMLCHQDPATTSETYVHLTADDLRYLLSDTLVNLESNSDTENRRA